MLPETVEKGLHLVSAVAGGRAGLGLQTKFNLLTVFLFTVKDDCFKIGIFFAELIVTP
jgi:hypothetical protein